jgi:predicted DNA binding CopG/RHH family protein
MSAFRWTDPYDEMSDEELDEYTARAFAKRRSTVAVSLRIAPELLGRLKREAARAGVPYQTFLKGLLEAGVSRLERTPARRKRGRGTAGHATPSAR